MLRQHIIRQLWSVFTAVQQTNTRTAGISPSNPIKYAQHWSYVLIEIEMVQAPPLTTQSLTTLRIYGSISFPTIATQRFPPVGSPSQVYLEAVSGGAPALQPGQGVTYAVSLNVRTANTALCNWQHPPRLILEYSTSAPGANPGLEFRVTGGFYGGGLLP